MILRRLSQSLKEQNWTAIPIEFVLLVLGVFLGIQVSNWNEQRAENAKAQAYLARIRGNLQSDLQSIDRRAAFWRQVNGYGKAAIHYAETGERWTVPRGKRCWPSTRPASCGNGSVRTRPTRKCAAAANWA